MKFKFIFIFLFLPFLCTDSRAGEVEQVLKIKIPPFEAVSCDFSYNLSKNKYLLEAKFSTTGVLGAVYPFNGRYQARGKINNSQFIASKYNHYTKSPLNTRTSQLFYDDEGNLLYRLNKKNDKLKRTDYSDYEGEKGTNLPTVLANLMLQLKEQNNCESSYDVFNGKHHFKVIFADLGYDNMSDSENAFLDGLAIKCSMTVETNEEYQENFLFDIALNKHIYFWVKKEPLTSIPYLVKVEAKYSNLRKISVYADEVKIKE